MSDFISMLVANTMYSIIRGDYLWCLWCSVGIIGDDLGGDLVPHVSRVGLGILHVRMSHNCLCAGCELRVCRCCVLGDYLWSMNHILVENCWWRFGEYFKCTYVSVYEPWDILMIDYSCLYILIMIDVKLTRSGMCWTAYLFVWMGRRHVGLVWLAFLVSARG